jgi:hypothetical protein
MISPSSAPSAHPHVSYISHPHSKDVNNSAGVYSEAGDYSGHGNGITHLEARVMGLETEFKDFKTKISQKINTPGIIFESSQKEMTHTLEKQLASFAKDQQERFKTFYACSLFGVSHTPLHTIYQFLTRLRSWVSRRC